MRTRRPPPPCWFAATHELLLYSTHKKAASATATPPAFYARVAVVSDRPTRSVGHSRHAIPFPSMFNLVTIIYYVCVPLCTRLVPNNQFVRVFTAKRNENPGDVVVVVVVVVVIMMLSSGIVPAMLIES